MTWKRVHRSLAAALVSGAAVLHQGTAAGQEALGLHLTIAADSISITDTLWTRMSLQNLATNSMSLCIAESHYTLRGRANLKIDRGPTAEGPCIEELQLAPQEARVWQDTVTVPPTALTEPGAVVIQYHIRVWYAPCEGSECVIELRSEPRLVTFSAGP